LGPYDDDTHHGADVISASMLSAMTSCNVNYPSLCEINPNMMSNFVWTWDIKQPSSTQAEINCALLRENSRWATDWCTTFRPAACVMNNNPLDWQLSEDVNWDGASAACQAINGFFSVPTDGYMNSFIPVHNLTSGVWINWIAQWDPHS